MFPKHQAGLYLTHNQHKDYYETVEGYLQNPWLEDVFLTPEERQKMIDTNEIWELQWYPNTPISFYIVAGPSLEVVLEKARQVETEEQL